MSDREVREPGLRCVLPFAATASEMRMLRRAAGNQLGRWGMPVDTDEVALLVTELATNVIKHVGEGVTAALVLEWRGGRLRIEMHDGSRMMPARASMSCAEACGRGLHLLATLAADWGAAPTAAGKSVWCEVELRGQTCRRLERAACALEGYAGGKVDFRHTVNRIGLEEAAIELIADLLHWTASRGHDPDEILDRAQVHYEAEAGAA
ncbi:ATP-binding protein [Streptomyces misionensis]|uniref:ATP-binding protein n=1 Tax=Streptomyces misionensis TaxID=67331 RepID=UPI0033EBC66E